MAKAVQPDRAEVAAPEPMQLGMLARRRGDRLAALAHFSEAAAADPASIRPRVELARELMELGRPRDAEAVLRSVLEDAPDQPQTHALLAHLGRQPGRLSNAAARRLGTLPGADRCRASPCDGHSS